MAEKDLNYISFGGNTYRPKDPRVGSMNDLKTTEKSDLVKAVNEVFDNMLPSDAEISWEDITNKPFYEYECEKLLFSEYNMAFNTQHPIDSPLIVGDNYIVDINGISQVLECERITSNLIGFQLIVAGESLRLCQDVLGLEYVKLVHIDGDTASMYTVQISQSDSFIVINSEQVKSAPRLLYEFDISEGLYTGGNPLRDNGLSLKDFAYYEVIYAEGKSNFFSSGKIPRGKATKLQYITAAMNSRQVVYDADHTISFREGKRGTVGSSGISYATNNEVAVPFQIIGYYE